MSDQVVWNLDGRKLVRGVALPDPEGGWYVVSTNLPGCATQGETLEEAKANFQEAAEGIAEACALENKPIPWGDVEVLRSVDICVAINEVSPTPQDASRT